MNCWLGLTFCASVTPLWSHISKLLCFILITLYQKNIVNMFCTNLHSYDESLFYDSFSEKNLTTLFFSHTRRHHSEWNKIGIANPRFIWPHLINRYLQLLGDYHVCFVLFFNQQLFYETNSIACLLSLITMIIPEMLLKWYFFRIRAKLIISCLQIYITQVWKNQWLPTFHFFKNLFYLSWSNWFTPVLILNELEISSLLKRLMSCPH